MQRRMSMHFLPNQWKDFCQKAVTASRTIFMTLRMKDWKNNPKMDSNMHEKDCDFIFWS